MSDLVDVITLSRQQLLELVDSQVQEIEKLKAYAQEQAKLLAFATHELRTPLSSIVGLAQLLMRSTAITHDTKKSIANIEKCANYLLALIKNMLEGIRLEEGQYQPVLNWISLDQIIEEVYQLLNPLAKDKKLLLYIDNKTTTNHIFSNAQILKQILINLLGNAIKFTHQGYIAIQTTVKTEHNNLTYCSIKVIDTGPGIPKDKLTVIFEPFISLTHFEQSIEKNYDSTGLGLAIVKKLAKLINLTIQVESTVGKGSIFSLDGTFDINLGHVGNLPVTAPLSSPPSHHDPMIYLSLQSNDASSNQSIEKLIQKKITVLLIDDDPISKYIHEKLLLNLGCLIDSCSNSREIPICLKKYHIIFVDLHLPDMIGYKVIQSIRDKNHTTLHIPIIILTADINQDEKMICLREGATAFAIKPISQQQLASLLQRYVK